MTVDNQSSYLKKPIFLLASERSGSNLIRAMFDSHPSIAAPAPPHLLSTFFPLLPFYGQLEEDQNFDALCRDIIKAVDVQVGDWHSSFTIEYLRQHVATRDLLGIYDLLYSIETNNNKKTRTFIKENFSFDYAYYLLNYFPDAKFIYLLRDGRDFALSYLKSSSHFETLDQISNRWRDEQRKCMAIYTELARSNNFYAIHYEDLITYPRETLQEMCAFVGEDYSDDMLQYHQNETVATDAKKVKDWQNIDKPVIGMNFHKYKRELTQKQIKYFEQIANSELVLAGYGLDNKVGEQSQAKKALSIVTKGFDMAKNFAKGKTMSIDELKLRKQRFDTINQINNSLAQNAKPLFYCKAIQEQENNSQ